MEPLYLPTLHRIAVCGGTHGNELSGIHLVREWQQKRRRREEGARSFTIMMLLSNPRAIQQGRRYTETDLNRCFTYAILSSPLSVKSPYEMVRSQELNALLGPKGSPKAVDVLCDLHNTTANMGLCLIAYSDCDWICLHICKHLQREMAATPVRYIHFDLPSSEAYSLESVGKHGFAMEVGPQPHGVVRADIYTAMEEGVQLMLEWIRLFNSGAQFEGGAVDVYTMVRNIDYPRDPETLNITAAVHPELQDRDFCLLHPGDPIFLTFSGETVRYKGTEPLYPFFINECAYYEKGIALSLAKRRRVRIPPIQMERG